MCIQNSLIYPKYRNNKEAESLITSQLVVLEVQLYFQDNLTSQGFTYLLVF